MNSVYYLFAILNKIPIINYAFHGSRYRKESCPRR